MSYYPEHTFIREFARRTLANIECINSGHPIKWEDTVLICFLLAVFVVPQDRRDPSGKNHTDVSGADGRKPPSVRTPVGTKRLILTTRLQNPRLVFPQAERPYICLHRNGARSGTASGHERRF